MSASTTIDRPARKAPEPSADRKPSARQVYAIAHNALELLELDWPTDRRAASELLTRLREARGTSTSGTDADF